MRGFLSMMLVVVLAGPASSDKIRIKELVEVKGVRPNHLVGVGLVVGLNGTGDDASAPTTRRALVGMMKKLGMSVDAVQVKQIKAKNVALVTVTATLASYARAGTALDVLVSSAGSARSLAGGTLLLTPLKGADLATYALAQGPISLGGFSAEGATGSRVTKNHPTVGRIPGGARVEVDAPGQLVSTSSGGGGRVELILRSPDFATATRIAEAISTAVGKDSATVVDPGLVVVKAPEPGQIVPLMARIEALEVEPEAVARVVINERTGTIVVGANVKLGAATIAHGGLTVRVQEERVPSQPGPLSEGTTVVTPRSGVQVEEAQGRLVFVAGAASAGDVANALNTLGVKPRDLVAVFQALHQAGALHAEIVLQ